MDISSRKHFKSRKWREREKEQAKNRNKGKGNGQKGKEIMKKKKTKCPSLYLTEMIFGNFAET